MYANCLSCKFHSGMCVFIYVCIYVYIYIYIHTYYICMCIRFAGYTCTYICIYIHTYIHIYTSISWYARTSTHPILQHSTYIHAHSIYIYMHSLQSCCTYGHTHTHIYIHTYIQCIYKHTHCNHVAQAVAAITRGQCDVCGLVVTLEQPRQKMPDGSYRHDDCVKLMEIKKVVCLRLTSIYIYIYIYIYICVCV